jgi:hypothetical protein
MCTHRLLRGLVALALVASLGAVRVPAQSFNSESDGSDGALTLTNPTPEEPIVIEFDPRSFQPPVDVDGDNVYHFTSITIGPGVTVHLSARRLSGPIFWLATGDVEVEGSIALDGDGGHPADAVLNNAFRLPSVGGAGGFGGGVGGTLDSFPQSGTGRGGATASFAQSNAGGAGAGYATDGGTADRCYNHAPCGSPGRAYGGTFVVPLLGGSGGAGGTYDVPIGEGGGGGGAGGGALTIAAAGTVAINGSISADGGRGGDSSAFAGGGGSGGAIHVVAPTILGDGTLSARGGARGLGFTAGFGNGHGGGGASGRIRLEAFTHQFSGTSNPVAVLASPVRVFLESQPAAAVLRVTSIGGVAIDAPTASLVMPDAMVETNEPIAVGIEARHIPIGTVVQLHLVSENQPDTVLESTPLAGSDGLSTAMVTIDRLPAGFSRGFLRAKWGGAQ